MGLLVVASLIEPLFVGAVRALMPTPGGLAVSQFADSVFEMPRMEVDLTAPRGISVSLSVAFYVGAVCAPMPPPAGLAIRQRSHSPIEVCLFDRIHRIGARRAVPHMSAVHVSSLDVCVLANACGCSNSLARCGAGNPASERDSYLPPTDATLKVSLRVDV